MEELRVGKDFGSTVIIVPHEDDEILMAAGLMYRLQKMKQPLTVVMVTNGDYESKDFSKGFGRLRETIRGLRVLGISSDHLIILGYADTGMEPDQSFLTHLYEEQDAQKIYPSSCSRWTYSIPEKPELHRVYSGKPALYNRMCLKEDLKRVLSNLQPKNIVTTAECDRHGDHAALYRFVIEILDEMREKQYMPNVYCGLIHSCAGDDCWPVPGTSVFTCPEGLEETTDLAWSDRMVFTLPEEMTRSQGKKNLKYQALSQYVIALEPDAIDFLIAFVKDEEIFWKIRREGS
ncbi:MAG: PIG-L deacetylase family protein [Bilifractor sp.]